MTKKLLPLCFVLLSGVASGVFAAPETAPKTPVTPAPVVASAAPVTTPTPVAATTSTASVPATAAPSVTPAPATPVPAKPAAAANGIKVALNSADVATLDRDLLGIGAAKARSIVEYRDAHGPFAAVDELLEVRGIGEALLERNRERITLE